MNSLKAWVSQSTVKTERGGTVPKPPVKNVETSKKELTKHSALLQKVADAKKLSGHADTASKNVAEGKTKHATAAIMHKAAAKEHKAVAKEAKAAGKQHTASEHASKAAEHDSAASQHDEYARDEQGRFTSK